MRNPQAAATRIAKGRFRDTLDNEEDSLHNLQRNTIFRGAVFVLGALPQVLKLCAVEGRLWAKIWGLMFFTSFIVLEFIVLLLGRGWRDLGPGEGSNNHENLKVCIGVMVFTASSAHSFYFIGLAGFAIGERYIGEARWPYFLGFVLLNLLFLVNVSSSMDDARTLLNVIVSLPPGLFASSGSRLPLPAFLGSSVPSHNVFHTSVIGASLFVTPVIAMRTMNRFIQRIRPAYANYSDFGLETYFLLLNLSAALLYYWWRYDAQGTVEPAWTDH